MLRWNQQNPTKMWEQKPFKMRSGIAVLQWAREEHVLGLVRWCAGELGAQIIHGWPGFFSAPPSPHPSFQGFAPVSACLFSQCLQPVEIKSKVFDPHTTHGLVWEPTWTHLPMLTLDTTAPKQGHFPVSPGPVQNCYFSTIHHPGFQGFAPVCGRLFTQCLQLVEITPRVFEPIAWGDGCSNNPSVVWRSETLGLISTGCRHWVKKHAQRMTAWRGAEWCRWYEMRWDETVLALVQRCAVPSHGEVGPQLIHGWSGGQRSLD